MPPAVRIEAPLDQLRRLRELQQQAALIRDGVTRYYNDPVGFARDCVRWHGEGLTAYQAEVLEALPVKRRVAVRGPHGLGKSALSSLVVLWFALTRDAAGVDWKVATTAGSWHQLTQYLWPEVHKWAGRLRWEEIRGGRAFTRAELQNLNLRLAHGNAFAAASANSALIEGAHADSLLFVYDEAKVIPAQTFDASEGAFSGQGEAFGLAVSTPGAPSGRFYDIHARRTGLEDWWCRHVTVDEAIAAGRIDPGWAEQRRRQWGESSALYANRVLGEFHADETDSIVPLGWVEAAVERWQAWATAGQSEPAGRRVIGVDVARSGSDRTVYAIRTGDVVQQLVVHAGQDTMTTAGQVAALLTYPQSLAVVDVIGVGAGVIDRLWELGREAVGFGAAERSTRTDRTGSFGFTNRRAEAWWGLRERLDPSTGSQLCLPPDDELIGDLTAPRWSVTSAGRIRVEEKDEIRRRLGRSTDIGDAVVQAFTVEGTPVSPTDPGSVPWSQRTVPGGALPWSDTPPATLTGAAIPWN